MSSTQAAAPTVALRDVIALGKPRITMMVLITTAAGIWLAPHPLATAPAVVTLIGVALVVAAANAFNMYLERDVDALMRRTRNRPLPSGRLGPEVALGFGMFCAVVGLPLVRATANPLTCALALASLVLYVFAYTPLKRRSPWALVVGAVPGAIPALLGWTASTGHVDAPGLA
ncbi:MAG TPA: protoheme IX farnesyltransferase, partial [Polyangia bacterium]|nr:protoheme IX farnesyltransferase [Polyangia bacterium]